MTDQTPPNTPAKGPRNWTRIALVLSVALNLLIVSTLAGAFWKNQTRHGPHLDRSSMGLGAYILALPKPAQSEIMSMIGKGSTDRRQFRREMRKNRQDLETALKAEPFSREDVQAAMNKQRDGAVTRTLKIQKAYLDALSDMTETGRVAHFERAEELLKQRRKKKRKKKN